MGRSSPSTIPQLRSSYRDRPTVQRILLRGRGILGEAAQPFQSYGKSYSQTVQAYLRGESGLRVYRLAAASNDVSR